jgi:hypothetical protein
VANQRRLCGLTIFHRLNTFCFQKLLKSGQTMKNRQTILTDFSIKEIAVLKNGFNEVEKLGENNAAWPLIFQKKGAIS